MHQPPLAVVFGLAGLSLSAAERSFFQETQPLGFILFQRNCADPAQIAALSAELRAVTGRSDTPILIDQEGGRVQRLKPPHWPSYPPAAAYGALYARDPDLGTRAAWLAGHLLAADLAELGINVDCAPVLDLRIAGADAVIGDRALGETPGQVATLGAAMIAGFVTGGVVPVIKHLPGHGRALLDSHEALPLIDAPLDLLDATDFAAFRTVAQGSLGARIWGMTAHVLLSAIDPARAATCSPVVVAEIIRSRIGFDGFLLSDDLSMKALGGDYGDRTRQALAAGCDAVLHCNGDLAEMQAIAAAARPLDAAALRRLAAAQPVRAPAFDLAAARTEFADLLAA